MKKKKLSQWEWSLVGKSPAFTALRGSGDFPAGNYACFAYGAARRMRSVGRASERGRGDTTKNLFDDDYPLINAEDWLLQADHVAARFKKIH